MGRSRRLQAYLAGMRGIIIERGWAVQAVGAGEGEPCFLYTVGLTRFHGHPEFIVFGLSPESACTALDRLSEQVRRGRWFTERSALGDLLPTLSVRLLRVADSSHHLRIANCLYRSAGAPPIPALQLVWSDEAGRFPWEAGYRMAPESQPLLGALPSGFTDG